MHDLVEDNSEIELCLIERARALIPVLKVRAAESDAKRTLPPETIRDFREAGFFKILQTPAYGGYGLSPHALCRVIFEVGRGDMSAGWVLSVLALHQYEVALMGEEARRTVWGDNPDALLASSVAPFGALEKVEGGYRLRGRWRFSSGIDHAEWVGIGGLIDVPGREGKDFRMSLLRTRDVVIDHDSWKAFGLAGTGSKDFDVDNVFVPDHMSFSLIDAHHMVGQGALPPNCRYPFWVVFNSLIGAAIIGGASGGVDEAIEQMRVRVSSSDNQVAANDPLVRLRVGTARVLVRTAMARYTAIYGEMDELVARGEPIPVDSRMHYLAEIAQCSRDSEAAVMTLYKATGARGVLLENNLQVVLRNVLSGANHIAMNLDPMLQNLGGVLLGAKIPPVLC